MKKDLIVLLVFSFAIIFASMVCIIQVNQTRLLYDKPLIDQTGSFYLCRVSYGKNHYFVACFDTPEELASFTRLGTAYTAKAGK